MNQILWLFYIIEEVNLEKIIQIVKNLLELPEQFTVQVVDMAQKI
ncbi:hypothetical protein SAMN05444484_101398 [Flavobacterium chilense]|uniref:Uncharacterized protein n=1 Tax=Flavobacterium chilense TaxID=946677 RepID=A0A1M6Y3L7_9FLAO|nr:hypothetical protein SAMN05444484_101398 [Flavobacterium chilense]